MARSMGRLLLAGQLKIFCAAIGVVALFLPFAGQQQTAEAASTAAPVPAAAVAVGLALPLSPWGERGRGVIGGTHDAGSTAILAPQHRHAPQAGGGKRQTRPSGPRPAPRPTRRPVGPLGPEPQAARELTRRR